MEQQNDAGNFGMWVFLVTEIMFFGGRFCGVRDLSRRCICPAFEFGSRLLDMKLGTTNTAVLIGSSLTMVLAVHAAQTGKRKALDYFFVADDGPGHGFSWDQILRIFTNGSTFWCRDCVSLPTERASR